ncbi:DNA mismatch repair endonuclease MutL [Paenibacillus abyssi]|uniref:DNA mismatch repair protein MutL n=1 Tax=Paenibacillus abyssi TaxID=1340531 RepID=A0A917CJI0_9BACL|nr:DNA mismatch repair endonuclease MutL [Paenibacillus abyssi]GGF89666.1 DNA mismatch repair protein MutL [Paenibacillus abyssi]
MGKIRVLDEQLANQIAAGEVVERPSSVVKELVENAIDAGSSTIDITVEEGGLNLIRVTDNGGGIEAEDMETAFQRHATSKLLSDKDLFRIASLGFRGEALPSIAAVSRVECISSTGEDGLARRIVIEGGTMSAAEPANAPQGTDMIIRDLFYNTPARLKYMKSIQTELGHISDYVYRLALAHPGTAFTLKHNGNTLLRTLGNGDRLQVIAAIYGTNTAKAMLSVEGEHPDYDLRGFVSRPDQTRANRNAMTTIVNGRYIRSFVLNQAIMQAFHTLLPINRYPLTVLDIGMHPSLVDVNVHPSKMEVRFSKEAELKTFVQQAVQATLSRQVHIPGPSSSGPRSKPAFVQERISFHQPEVDAEQPSLPASPLSAQHNKPSPAAAANWERPAQLPVTAPIPKDAAERLYKPGGRFTPEFAVREVSAWEREAAASLSPPKAERTESVNVTEAEKSFPPAASDAGDSAAAAAPASDVTANADASAFPELSWVGQLHGTYLIAQNEDGMYLIDQHAAHERIHYEYYLAKFGKPQDASQQLLVPLTLEFTSADASLLRERLELFEQAGVELEPFGTNTFLVRSHPEWLPKGDELSLIEEIAEWILSERKTVDIAKLREKSAILCSCKASIKANQRLSREEGETLLRRLAACTQPYTCPHGRPIVVHVSTYQLEKMFKRVMS